MKVAIGYKRSKRDNVLSTITISPEGLLDLVSKLSDQTGITDKQKRKLKKLEGFSEDSDSDSAYVVELDYDFVYQLSPALLSFSHHILSHGLYGAGRSFLNDPQTQALTEAYFGLMFVINQMIKTNSLSGSIVFTEIY